MGRGWELAQGAREFALNLLGAWGCRQEQGGWEWGLPPHALTICMQGTVLPCNSSAEGPIILVRTPLLAPLLCAWPCCRQRDEPVAVRLAKAMALAVHAQVWQYKRGAEQECELCGKAGARLAMPSGAVVCGPYIVLAQFRLELTKLSCLCPVNPLTNAHLPVPVPPGPRLFQRQGVWLRFSD